MKHKCEIEHINCEAYDSPLTPNGGMTIQWSGDIGFGEFSISFDENGVAHFYSEYMCSQNDKEFAKILFNKLIDEAVVEE